MLKIKDIPWNICGILTDTFKVLEYYFTDNCSGELICVSLIVYKTYNIYVYLIKLIRK